MFLLAPPAAALVGPNGVPVATWPPRGPALGGDGLASPRSAASAAVCLTSVSALVQTGPRVYARMAEDGLFPLPGAFAVRPDGSAPPPAVLFQALLAAAACSRAR